MLWQEFKRASDAACTDSVPSSIPSMRPFNSQSAPEIEKLYPLEEDFVVVLVRRRVNLENKKTYPLEIARALAKSRTTSIHQAFQRLRFMKPRNNLALLF